jgi:hypothetical protein
MFPEQVTLTTLPQPTREGREMQLLRITAAGKQPHHGLYIQAGIHAREWGTVDGLLFFLEQLMLAFLQGTDLTFQNQTFPADDIKNALKRVELFVVPCVNPDGRAFSMQPGDTPDSLPNVFWRSNRRDNGNPNANCIGVDLNRNFDWLWDFRHKFHPDAPGENPQGCLGNIIVSDDMCDLNQTYHGDKPFSEPEAQNVKSVLDEHRNIRVFLDLHGVLGRVMTPWGDDDVQTTDPDQSFTSHTFDGKRGLGEIACQGANVNPDDVAYKEYMHATDQSRYGVFQTLQHDAILGVRGTDYVTGTSFLEMYGTSGTSHDYAFARHIADSSLSKIDGYIYEFENIGGLGFQPPFESAPGPNDMIHVILDVAAGLTSLLLNTDRIPIVECTPMTLNFDRVRVGTSRQRSFSLFNRGVRAFDVTSVGFVGDAGPFGIAQPAHTHLEPGDEALVSVRVTPTAADVSHTRVAIEFAYPNETVKDVRLVLCKVSGCTVPDDACLAPTFPPSNWLTCLGRLIVYGSIIIALAIFAWIPSVRCTIKQLLFRIRHCGTGNTDPCRTL